MKKRYYYLIIIIISLLEIFTHWGHLYPDSITYTETMDYLFFGDGVRHEQRMIRPVTLLLAVPFAPLVGANNAFALISAIFWVAKAILLYEFVLRHLKNSRLALFSSLIFTSSIPMLFLGAAVLTDSGGYFFTLLIFYLLEKYRNGNFKTNIILSVIFAIGTLTRETTFIFLFLYLLIYEILMKRNLKFGLTIIVLTLIFSFIYYIPSGINPINSLYLGYTPFQGFDSGAKSYLSEVWGFMPFIESLLHAFLFIPIFAAIGFVVESKEKKYWYIAMILSVASIFAWSGMSPRYTFLFFPVVIPLSVLGIRKFSFWISKKSIFSFMSKEKYEVIIVLIYIVLANILFIAVLLLPEGTFSRAIPDNPLKQIVKSLLG